MGFKKMHVKFRKCDSGIIPLVSVGKEDIHKYLQYEVSVTV